PSLELGFYISAAVPPPSPPSPSSQRASEKRQVALSERPLFNHSTCFPIEPLSLAHLGYHMHGSKDCLGKTRDLFKKIRDIKGTFHAKMNNNKLWKILKEMGIPDHVTCLLGNLREKDGATIVPFLFSSVSQRQRMLIKCALNNISLYVYFVYLPHRVRAGRLPWWVGTAHLTLTLPSSTERLNKHTNVTSTQSLSRIVTLVCEDEYSKYLQRRIEVLTTKMGDVGVPPARAQALMAFEEPITFCEEAFVSHYRSGAMRQFLQNATQLQLFKQFIDGRLDLLNSGEGFSDVFEEEINMGEYAGSDKLYHQWLSTVRKGSGAILNTVKTKANPAMKTVYKFAKDHAKMGIKEVKNRLKQKDITENGCAPTTEEQLPKTAPSPLVEAKDPKFREDRRPITVHFGQLSISLERFSIPGPSLHLQIKDNNPRSVGCRQHGIPEPASCFPLSSFLHTLTFP
ncbi:hypothetical protein FD755_008397, partial [Muntiacus reevesi]